MSKPYVIWSDTNYGDTGAPQLTGQVGSLVNVLDAALVNGFNSKSVTSLVVSNNIGTVTCTGHGFKDRSAYLYKQVVNISGCNEAGYNGDWEIASITDADTFTITMPGASNGTATGTITAKQAPLGWTKEFSGTNKAAYRAGQPVTGNRLFYRVQDDSSVSEGARFSRINGYETMSGIDTGQNGFPASGYIVLQKAAAAGSVVRPYIIIGDAYGFHMFVWYNSTNTVGPTENAYYTHFGKIISEVPNDAWADLLAGGESSDYPSPILSICVNSPSISYVDKGMFFARKSNGQIGAVNCCKCPGFFGCSTLDMYSNKYPLGRVGLTFPFNNQTIYTRLALCEANRQSFRGYFAGLYYPCHDRPHTNFSAFADNDKKLFPIRIRVTGESGAPYVNHPEGQVYIDLGIGFRP